MDERDKERMEAEKERIERDKERMEAELEEIEEAEELDGDFEELKDRELRTHEKRIIRMARHGDRSMNGRGPKNVTIRGIDAQVYDDFSQNMKILSMTMGDAITQMMKDVLKDFDETFPTLSAKTFKSAARLPKLTIFEHDHICITAQDLIESEARVTFHDIGTLEFEPDVTKELFLRHVAHISDCKVVRLPSILPKLQVYSKIRDVSEIEIYDVDTTDE